MKIKSLVLAAVLLASSSMTVFAHDEGHGPHLSDVGKYGGLVAPVIDIKEANKGAKAALVYKAELVRSSDGTVRLYLYEPEMKPLDLQKIKSVDGALEAKVKGKLQSLTFGLKLESKAFIGKSPKAPVQPYSLEFEIKDWQRTLLTAFDNLD